MKNKMIARAMIAVMLAGSLPAMAQDRGYRDGYDSRAQERRDDRHEMRNDRREERRDYRDAQREARRDYRDDRREARREARGAGPRHDLYRGGRLPSHYHNRQYVVDNWRSHRLSAPPRGYHWVQVGGDYVLAAVATGIIASVLLGN
ncbi:RcnB family protein [Massilia litorea]|jgi:Ni/Co efflux regulator RcnB|uniref:RcnB family protein n=1 Tax=Massilia litorea TaxID=2769491 RepID=A0A7L9U726_9BURK|nr:RcnB family protein [Massilia litorea]QOL49856.1 RcnB family protein [Massilia litorea]